MRNFLAALFATFLVFLLLRWQSGSLVTSSTPRGIIDLEFCDNIASLEGILQAWDVNTARWAVIIDFGFILCFALVFYYGASFVHRRLGKQRRVTGMMRYFSFVPPALDVIENSLMLATLSGTRSELVLQVTRYTAILKFATAAVVVLYLLVSLLIIYGISKKATVPR